MAKVKERNCLDDFWKEIKGCAETGGRMKMNVDSGHLIKLAEQMPEMKEGLEKAYIPVPQELAAEAERELDGKSETYVDLSKPTPLAKWAAKKRSERDKKKAKRKIANVSRKKNRHK